MTLRPTINSSAHDAARCPACGRPVTLLSRQQSFCPHCGRRLRRGGGGRAPVVIAMVIVGLAVHRTVLHGHRPATPSAAVAVVDPVDADLARARDVRVDRLGDLDRRTAAARAARGAVAAQVDDLTNLSARIKAAAARAADEDHWPAVVAGRPFQRVEADAVVERIHVALSVERSAVVQDDAAVAALVAAAAPIRAQLDDIGRLRAELAGRPTSDQFTDVRRRADAYRAGVIRLPDVPAAAPSPVRPLDVDALLR